MAYKQWKDSLEGPPILFSSFFPPIPPYTPNCSSRDSQPSDFQQTAKDLVVLPGVGLGLAKANERKRKHLQVY